MNIHQIVDNYIAHLRADDDWMTQDKLHPSMVGQCPRKEIFRLRWLRGELDSDPLPEDPRTLRVFEMGHIVEGFILDALHHTGTLVLGQLEVWDEWFAGKIDGLCVEDGIFRIVEIKTVHSKAFQYGNMPYDHHIHQLMMYFMLFQSSWHEDRLPDIVYAYPSDDNLEITYPVIIYVSKDDLLIDTYPVNPEKYIAETQLRARLLIDYAERDELPDRPYSTPDEHPWACMRKGRPNCKWFGVCW